MAGKNVALYIPSAKAPFQVGPAEVYEPGPHDLLVKNVSLALNPLEYKVQKFAFLPQEYPNVSGWSFAGIVEKIGSEVTAFKPGDRIVAFKHVTGPKSGNQYGTFQKYALVQDRAAAKLDEKTNLDHASAVVSSFLSTVGALSMCMGMDYPPLSDKPAPRKNQKILIYGGSSIFGLVASEYAMRAGYDVVATASPRTKDEVKRFCPAATIVDHTMPREQLVQALVAEGPYDHFFDTITKPETKLIVAEVVKKLLGGGAFWSSQPARGPEPELPDGVERKGDSFPGLVDAKEEVRKWAVEEYLPKGLASGAITAPRIEKIAEGLKGVPGALERFGEGKVSGAKLVVDPWETED